MFNFSLTTAMLTLALQAAGGASLAQAPSASSCANYELQIAALRARFPQTPLWSDARLSKAQTSLAMLENSRQRLMTLERRLIRAEDSAANARAFERSGEANVWRRNEDVLRSQIDVEKRRGKTLAADAGVSCSGCTYSFLIAKVRDAISAAVGARVAAYQVSQQLLTYRSAMTSAHCKP